MILTSRNILLSVLACASVAALIMACGSDESKFSDPSPPVGNFGDGSFGIGDDADPGIDLYKNDPPPAWCGPDGGTPPPPITGTEDCPDDKNKPGCGCSTPGEQAQCWTGLRKNRNLGICKDGTTTCRAINETSNTWGPCEGQVLPTLGAKGKEACNCFSAGVWKLANTSPCLRTPGDGSYYAYSTVLEGDQATYCDANKYVPTPGTAPSPGIWSTDTLKVDCAGTFRLCYKIRAGNIDDPHPTDCTLGEVCIDADYPEENVEQPLPDLPTWAGSDQACAKLWEKETPEDVSPGYGEMIVKGKSVRCEAIDDGNGGDFVFHRVKYCPRICRESDPHYNPNHPECVDCQLRGTGEF